jgi:4-aminobutyrate aminotransferase-like enzyme
LFAVMKLEATNPPDIQPISHLGETRANAIRERLQAVEPLAQRTFTPTLAVIASSSGSYHITADGRKLADFTSGVLVANLGHHPARWWRRVWDYMGLKPGEAGEAYLSAIPLTSYNAATELEVQASTRLLASLRSSPGGQRLDQILWGASGSEAVQKALWAAQARRLGEDIILATRHGFHGKKGLSGAVTGTEDDPHRDPCVRFISFPRDECRNRQLRKQPLDLMPFGAELQNLRKEFGSRICCLITEPYLGGGGSFHPQPEYLQLLQRFCRQHDILFILDEVQSNFGRTGAMYAFETYGLEPDMVLLGKGLGNGIPTDAAAGRADVLGALRYGEGSDTWSGHPLGCAAILATLDEFAELDVLTQGRTLSAVLEEGLSRLETLGIVAHIRGEGTVWGVECAPIGQHTASEVAIACVLACYRGDAAGRAIHLLGPLAGSVLRVSPPLTMPPAEAREYLDAMFEIFQATEQRLSGASD